MDPELRTILTNLELGRRYWDWDIVDRAIQRLAEYTLTTEKEHF
ncbi:MULTISPECIES: hypothetical protein [Nocardia]|nr:MULTISPECIES: hypothetical protein [Nocardia]